jgi:hypothetical protein
MKLIGRRLVLAIPLVLAACGNDGLRDTLGLNRDAPDEFTVLSRPPLSVPPEFNLAPPVAGAEPLAPTAEQVAKEAVLGDESKKSSEEKNAKPDSKAEKDKAASDAFLKRAGADDANNDIRRTLGSDAMQPADTSKAKTLLDKLRGAEKIEPVVDAKKEAERLRSNKDEKKPVTEGDVPVQEEKPSSVLDRIF